MSSLPQDVDLDSCKSGAGPKLMKESCVQGNLRTQRRDLQDQQRAAKTCKAMTVASTEILLLRHGETDWNLKFRLGQTPPHPSFERHLADWTVASTKSFDHDLPKQFVLLRKYPARLPPWESAPFKREQEGVGCRLQGQHPEDPPLNATGTEQSRVLADRLVLENSLMASWAEQLVRTDPLAPDLACPITAVYSSDLRRAVQTATAAADALGLPVSLEPTLRERHLGVLEVSDLWPHDTLNRAPLEGTCTEYISSYQACTSATEEQSSMCCVFAQPLMVRLPDMAM